MPVVKGFVGTTEVNTLRDTGCSGIVVREQLVKNDQYTGQVQTCMLMDGSIIRVPVANITISTPFLSGTFDAMCMKHPVPQLIQGQGPGRGRGQVTLINVL